MSAARVKSMWESIQAMAWDEMRLHFTPDAQMIWPVTGEAFQGRDAIVAVNENYPSGWSIEILAIDELADGRVVSRVKVSQPPNEFFAVTFFSFTGDLISNAEEYWSTKEEPEAWRNEKSIPGWRRI